MFVIITLTRSLFKCALSGSGGITSAAIGIIIAMAGNELWSQNSTSLTESRRHDGDGDDDENNDFSLFENN